MPPWEAGPFRLPQGFKVSKGLDPIGVVSFVCASVFHVILHYWGTSHLNGIIYLYITPINPNVNPIRYPNVIPTTPN